MDQHVDPHSNDRGLYPAQERSAVGARQGVISGRVLTVLLASLVLVIVAFSVSYFLVR